MGKTEGATTRTLDYAGTVHKHAPASVDGVAYSYDENGNLIGRSGVTYQYDVENRLVKVTGPSGYVARFIYDGNGGRAKRVDSYGTIIYVGGHYERNVGNGQDTSDTVTKMYSAKLGARSRLVAVRKAANLSWVYPDHLGSMRKLSGGSSAAFKYYPFGTIFPSIPEAPTDNLFTGQKRDASTGLYFYGARYYDGQIGRFVQPDTVVPDPGNPQDLNRYTYTRNNPARYVDPTGHYTDKELEEYLGEDWEEAYFGKEGIFEGYDNLQGMLRSEKTTDLKALQFISWIFKGVRAVRDKTGRRFSERYDAIGARISGSGGTGGYAQLTAEAVLNLTSGEFSYFVASGGGWLGGAELTGSVSLLFMQDLPDNRSYRGAFYSVGAVATIPVPILGESGPGLAVEYDWSPGVNIGANGWSPGVAYGWGAGVYFGVSFYLEA